MGISHEEFYGLFSTVERTAVHLEMRDSYGTEVELPHLAKWANGEPDDDGWLQPWLSLVGKSVGAGRSWRRAQLYSRTFEQLQRSAVYGHEARELVASARADFAD